MESNVPGIRPELQSSVPGVRLRLSPEAEILFSRAMKHALTFVPITCLHEYENLKKMQIIQMITIPLQLQDIFSFV